MRYDHEDLKKAYKEVKTVADVMCKHDYSSLKGKEIDDYETVRDRAKMMCYYIQRELNKNIQPIYSRPLN